MKRTFLWSATLLALFAFGCGGGGGGDGGGDGNGGSGSFGYAGKTTQAVVDDANADTLAEASMTGPEVGFGLQDLGSGGGAAPRTGAARVLVDTALAVAKRHRVAARSAAQTIPVSEQGDCGGTLTGNLEFAGESFFDFDADLEFGDYCTDGTTVDGSLSVTCRSQGDDTIVIRESFDGLEIDDGTEHVLLEGKVVANMALLAETGTLTLNLTGEDLATHEQIWFDNFVIEIQDNFAEETLSLVGRVYHGDHGYVDVTTDVTSAAAAFYEIPADTVASLVVPETAEKPSSGGILLVGDEGTAAILHVLDETQYEVLVDVDGDGSFDGPADTRLGPFFWD